MPRRGAVVPARVGLFFLAKACRFSLSPDQPIFAALQRPNSASALCACAVERGSVHEIRLLTALGAAGKQHETPSAGREGIEPRTASDVDAKLQQHRTPS